MKDWRSLGPLTIDWADVEIAPPSSKRIDDPKHWRDRADEARIKAELMLDEQAVETMLRVAEQYDRLAWKVEMGAYRVN
jgi:hypothetical protein